MIRANSFLTATVLCMGFLVPLVDLCAVVLMSAPSSYINARSNSVYTVARFASWLISLNIALCVVSRFIIPAEFFGWHGPEVEAFLAAEREMLLDTFHIPLIYLFYCLDPVLVACHGPRALFLTVMFTHLIICIHQNHLSLLPAALACSGGVAVTTLSSWYCSYLQKAACHSRGRAVGSKEHALSEDCGDGEASEGACRDSVSPQPTPSASSAPARPTCREHPQQASSECPQWEATTVAAPSPTAPTQHLEYRSPLGPIPRVISIKVRAPGALSLSLVFVALHTCFVSSGCAERGSLVFTCAVSARRIFASVARDDSRAPRRCETRHTPG